MRTQSDSQLFLRLNKRLVVQPGQTLYLGDVAQVIIPEAYEELYQHPVYTVPVNEHFVVLDVMQIIERVVQYDPALQVEAIGNTEIILELKGKSRPPMRISLVLVWLVLFVGSGLAIMNFHTDVSMVEVHQRIYYLMTGEMTERPLWIQIPYSFGIGLGMVLFFNHVFKRRINEEPTPLEVEMNLYEESIDRYVIRKEQEKGRQP